MGRQGHSDQIKHVGRYMAFLCMCLCMAILPVQAETLPYQNGKQTGNSAQNQKLAGSRYLQPRQMQGGSAFRDGTPGLDDFFSNDTTATGLMSESDILDSVLGLSQQTDWLGDTNRANAQGNSAVLDIMQSYVNVVNVPGQPFGGDQRSNSSSGSSNQGMVMSLADSLQGPLASSLITDILRPDTQGDLVTFSLFGFGNFLLFGDQQSGNLSMVNLDSGQILDLRSKGGYSANRHQGAAAPEIKTPKPSLSPPIRNTEPAPNIITWAINTFGSPLAIATYLCIFGVWIFWKLGRRFS